MTKSDQYYQDLLSFLKGININDAVKMSVFENALIEYLTKYHRIHIERTSHEGKDYPELTILDRTRNIFGYITIYTSRSYTKTEKLAKQIQIIYSELDRPVFYLHWNTNSESQEIRFATSDQIHDLILHNMEDTSDLSAQVHSFPNYEDMGTFKELIELFKRNT